MKKTLLTFSLIAASLLCGAQRATTLIIQLTDPQFGFTTSNKDFAFETARFTQAVEAVNALTPDAVVFTGDLVHDFKSEAQWAEFNRITSLLNPSIKLLYIPGNHDIRMKDGLVDTEPYISHTGRPDHFSVKINNVILTGLDSNLIKYEDESSGREKEQIDWMEKVLRGKKKGDVSIVFTHHPFFVHSIDEEEAYANIAPNKRGAYFAIFKKLGVSDVFSGHLHDNSENSFDGVGMIATTAVGAQLGEAIPGLRIIKVKGKKVKESYFSFDEVPPSRKELEALFNE